MKQRIEGLFSTKSLRWILMISLQLKHSSPCGGLAASNDGSWWPPVVEKKLLGFGLAFGEKKVKICFFHAEKCIYNSQISLNELISLRVHF